MVIHENAPGNEDDISFSAENTTRITPTSRCRYWFFTFNNPTTDDWVKLQDCVQHEDGIFEWLIFQYESGESGTPHYQGTLKTYKQEYGRTMFALFEGRVHWECTRSVPGAIKYCSDEKKRLPGESGPWKFGRVPLYHGKFKGQGSRTDLDEVHDSFKAGSTVTELYDKHFGSFARYNGNLTKIRRSFIKKRNFQTRLVIFWGDTGMNKTKFAETLFGEFASPLVASNGTLGNNIWFEEYDTLEHPTVVFDEFDGSWFPWYRFLNLTGPGHAIASIKGGSATFAPKTIVFTSRHPPEKWYPNMQEKGEYDQFYRRISDGGGCIVHFRRHSVNGPQLLLKFGVRPPELIIGDNVQFIDTSVPIELQ